jgi:hypothetical protein
MLQVAEVDVIGFWFIYKRCTRVENVVLPLLWIWSSELAEERTLRSFPWHILFQWDSI